MPKTVRIYGVAPNIAKTPPLPIGVEAWLANSTAGYKRRLFRTVKNAEWTRWFNLHSKRHMLKTYTHAYNYYKEWCSKDGRRVILQEVQDDIPGSERFPKEILQHYFSIDGTPFRYFTCSVCWFIALAIYEGFDRIELWGFQVKATKPAYAYERPCIAYWVDKARKAGIDVWLPPELKPFTPDEIGDPAAYTGPLYGYETT